MEERSRELVGDGAWLEKAPKDDGVKEAVYAPPLCGPSQKLFFAAIRAKNAKFKNFHHEEREDARRGLLPQPSS